MGLHRFSGVSVVRVAIHQPQYLPWTTLIAKACFADVFVLLDDVQFQRRGFQNRTLVTHAGQDTYVTIPVEKHGQKTAIRDIAISYEIPWQEKHIQTWRMLLGHQGAENSEAVDDLVQILRRRPRHLCDFTVPTMDWMLRWAGIHCTTVLSSDLNVQGDRESRIVALCSALGATEYVSGTGAASYQARESFEASGVELTYLHPSSVLTDATTDLLSPYSGVSTVLKFGHRLPALIREQFECRQSD